jgi:hypothetical protein
LAFLTFLSTLKYVEKQGDIDQMAGVQRAREISVTPEIKERIEGHEWVKARIGDKEYLLDPAILKNELRGDELSELQEKVLNSTYELLHQLKLSQVLKISFHHFSDEEVEWFGGKSNAPKFSARLKSSQLYVTVDKYDECDHPILGKVEARYVVQLYTNTLNIPSLKHIHDITPNQKRKDAEKLEKEVMESIASSINDLTKEKVVVKHVDIRGREVVREAAIANP